MRTLLFNPFKKYSEMQLLTVGLITAVLGILFAALTNTHFDGVLDTHFSKNVTLKIAAIESLINIVSLTTVFFAFGKIINFKTRLIDIFNIALIAKIPAYFMMPLNINNWINHKTETIIQDLTVPVNFDFNMTDLFFLLFISTISIIIFVWLILLLYNGFKVATNLKGIKHVLLFIIGIITAEIISKILINQFL